MPQLSEKPHLGFATKKTAWNPGPNVCNFTVTLGLQVVVSENGVRKTYSARYYNPNTGRFMSRDPNEPKLRDANGKPLDPRKLHKYLYTGGDPVNWIDPRGREAMVEDAELESEEDVAATVEARKVGIRLAGCFFGIAWTIKEIADENWLETAGAALPTAAACYEFLPGVPPFPPEPPMPPVTPPAEPPLPPPPPPGLPPNWCGLECWTPPPGTPIN
jgi:RHS repeat-associated protein